LKYKCQLNSFVSCGDDIAWSSVREPTQVFQLLETIYHAFDEIARRRRVFKVETVGGKAIENQASL
jgi:hypothetical protein